MFFFYFSYPVSSSSKFHQLMIKVHEGLCKFSCFILFGLWRILRRHAPLHPNDGDYETDLSSLFLFEFLVTTRLDTGATKWIAELRSTDSKLGKSVSSEYWHPIRPANWEKELLQNLQTGNWKVRSQFIQRFILIFNFITE